MKFCNAHWQKLAETVHTVGLGPFIAPNADEAQRRLRLGAEQKQITAENFEPLLMAHNMIFNAVIGQASPLFAFVDPCPICYLLQTVVGALDEENVAWTEESLLHHYIREPVDAIRNEAERIGLLPIKTN